MSWSPILPRGGTTSRRESFVALGFMKKTRTSSPSLLVILRPYLVSDAPAWLAAGQTVAAMLGGGEHVGMLRLAVGSVFKLRGTASNVPGKPVLQLRLPPLAGSSLDFRKSAPVEFEYSDDWIDITLPEWARGNAPTTEAPRQPPAATSPERGKQLAAAAAEMARRRAGL